MIEAPDFVAIPTDEFIKECAVNTDLYSRTYFPRACSQVTPEFHHQMDEVLENPAYPLVAIEAFRGSGKTTKTRLAVSRRIAYGNSRTILFIGATQDHAVKSVMWIRGAVEAQGRWAKDFGLKPGRKWTDVWIEIWHETYQCYINVVAYGMTGSIRGVNIEDARPDYIIADDPCDDENSGTEEARAKLADLFFGALYKTLAPQTEVPDAKMVLLQTAIKKGDLISQAHESASWKTIKVSCFTPEGESAWPERFPTAKLLADKADYIRRNQLSLWLREMECKLQSAETATFKPEWLQNWFTEPEGLITVLSIDPVPPPAKNASEAKIRRNDYEVITVAGILKGKRYILEQSFSKGHTPERTVAETFRLALKWKIRKIIVESVGYQRALRWLLEQAMQKRQTYYQVDEFNDKRSKRYRIEQGFSGIASQGQLFVHPTMVHFIEEFTSYPDVEHDDFLDSAAMALAALAGLDYSGTDVETEEEPDEETKKVLKEWRVAP